MTTTEPNHAVENAKAHAQTILAMVRRLDHVQECSGEDCDLTDTEILAGLGIVGDAATKEQREAYHDEDAAMEAILEYPLSVEIRSSWHSPRESDNPTEYQILLSTGGPAARIIGKLNEYGEPETAVLQYQDWGTPWTDYAANAEETETLLEYARYFYFEEATR